MFKESLEIRQMREENLRILEQLSSRRRTKGMDYYIPNRMQMKAHKSEARTILLCAGNRAGKTHFGAMELCFHLTRKYPKWYPQSKRFKHPIRAVVSATSFAIVRRAIEPKIFALLPRDYYTYRKSAQGYLASIICKDGSSVDILTLEMHDAAYESAAWHFAWEDEPQQQRKREGIVRGLVDFNGLEVITFTPITEPWMKEELIDKADGKTIALFTSTIRDNMFDIKGNTILTKSGIERFEETISEEYREARLEGIFFTLRGRIYKEFGISHIKSGMRHEGNPVICVLDPHDRLPHHIIWAYIDRDDDINVEYECEIHCELPQLAKTILNIEADRKYFMKQRLIDPNFGRKPARAGSNFSVMQELSKHGCHFAEPCDDIELGHMIVREYLHYDRKKPITAVNKPKLFFSQENCPKTIRSMTNLQYEEWVGKTRGDKDPKERERQKGTHGADTVRYLCIERPSFRGILNRYKQEETLAENPY